MLSFRGGMWICIHIPLVMQNLEKDLSVNSLPHDSLYTKVGLFHSSQTFLIESRASGNRPWWPSGLGWHSIPQLIVAIEGPRFESRLRFAYGWIYMDKFIIDNISPAIIVVLLYLCQRNMNMSLNYLFDYGR